jgi:hypothetical protein
MFRIHEYSDSLNLDKFYRTATERKFYNNNSKERLIDTFKHLDFWKVWIVYYNEIAVGSVAAHSLEELGILGDAYRIGARLCSFDNLIGERKTLRTANTVLAKHQSLTSQLLVPICIDYLGKDKDLYLSTNENEIGTQRLVHRIACPIWRKIGVLSDPIELEYRSTIQSFWRVNTEEFYHQMETYWWPEARLALDQFRLSQNVQATTPLSLV